MQAQDCWLSITDWKWRRWVRSGRALICPDRQPRKPRSCLRPLRLHPGQQLRNRQRPLRPLRPPVPPLRRRRFLPSLSQQLRMAPNQGRLRPLRLQPRQRLPWPPILWSLLALCLQWQQKIQGRSLARLRWTGSTRCSRKCSRTPRSQRRSSTTPPSRRLCQRNCPRYPQSLIAVPKSRRRRAELRLPSPGPRRRPLASPA